MWKYNQTENLPGNSLYHSADELYHYGVVGMRWRHRKAQLIETRKQRANQRVINLKNKGVSVNKINKAKIKADKINRSRYGQTRTQIIGKGILKSMAANVISNSAAKVAKSYGRDDVASIIRIANSGYNTVNAVKTGYRAITNYDPPKKYKG